MTSPSVSIPEHKPHGFGGALIAWALLRLIPVLVLLYALKDWILNVIGDPHRLTIFVIGITSTPVARLLIFIGFAAALTVICYSALRLWPRAGYWFAVAAATVITALLFKLTGTSLSRAVPVVVLLATNLLPDRVFERLLPTAARRDYAMALAVGIAEVFFLRRFLTWIAELWTGRRFGNWPNFAAAGLAAVVAAAAAAVLITPEKISALEQSARMPAEARVLAEGDFNWIELDPSASNLFVTGHGVPRLLKFDTADLDREPRAVTVDTGNAQAFAQDRGTGEIFIYNEKTRELMVFDTTTLDLKRSVPVTGVASGDPWMATDEKTNSIVIVSEADIADGASFLTLDRTTGAVLDKRDLDAGNVLLVPETSRLYMSFFRRREGLIRYDIATRTIDKEVHAPARSDRMAYWADRNEVLLAVPVASQVLRYDAETLALKGEFEAIFGIRTLAIDPSRRLLLGASLATGEIAIIDLDTSEVRSRHYLGPWLRSVVVDPNKGVAYVSSKGFLYELKYGDLQ